MCGRQTKNGHDGVADEFLNQAAVLFNAGRPAFKIFVDDLAHILGVELFGHGGEVDQIGEEHGDQLALFAEGWLFFRWPGRGSCRARLGAVVQCGAVEQHGKPGAQGRQRGFHHFVAQKTALGFQGRNRPLDLCDLLICRPGIMIGCHNATIIIYNISIDDLLDKNVSSIYNGSEESDRERIDAPGP